MCAVGDEEGIIRIYNSEPYKLLDSEKVVGKDNKDKKPFKKCDIIKHRSSAITHLDFSADGNHLMVNNVDEELFFVKTKGTRD